jgi:hypothetical protein
MAHLFALRNEPDCARQARSVADHLGKPDARPSLNPFVYALVEKTLTILTREQEEREKKAKEEAEASLIVKP